MPDCIIVDLDGTLADCGHRRHYLNEIPPNWNNFLENMGQDEVVYPIAQLLDMYRDRGVQIILCSGRGEEYRDKTDKWLIDNEIFYDYLLMRPMNDSRPDEVIKKEILDHKIRPLGYNILFCLDDRQKIVDLYRAEGLLVFQVAPGDFDTKKTFHIEHPGRLTLMIGPSGAGKTYFLKNKLLSRFSYEDTVSSDEIRAKICGDSRDRSRDKQVFNAMHNLIKARIEAGFDCIVDATNLRDKDRRAIRDLVPANCKIEYIVIDRPMEEKVRDGGWRNEIIIKEQILLDRHAEVFKMNLKNILNGDGDSRVQVVDLRR